MTSKKDRALIIDLDGTLFDSSHRLKYIDGSLGNKDWVSFYSAMKDDPVNKWCSSIISAFGNDDDDYDLVFLFITGRPEKYRDLTLEAFKNNYICTHTCTKFKLHMRKDGDYRKDYIIKKEIYDNEVAGKYSVLFAIEDRKQVVDMWREQGIVCLQCDEGKF